MSMLRKIPSFGLVFTLALVFGGVWLLTHPTTNANQPNKPAPREKAKTQESTLKIAGMSCGGCVARITETLEGIKGVQKVKVTLKPPQATVAFDPKLTSTEKLAAAIREAGYRVLP